MFVITVYAIALHLAICPFFGFGAWLANEFNITTDRLLDYSLIGMMLPAIILAVVGTLIG